MKPLTQEIAKHLREAAAYYGCNLNLSISSTGIMVKAQKNTNPLGQSGVSINTEITFWVDANEDRVGQLTTKALQSLP